MAAAAGATMDPAFRRRQECLRKQRYRAAKRSEIKMLEDEMCDLVAKLRQLQADYYLASGSPRSASFRDRFVERSPHRSPGHVAKAVHKHTAVLRAQVAAHRILVHKLANWVVQPTRTPHCLASSHCIATTRLPADPDTRRHGYHWLSERVFHAALAALPQHPFGAHVADTWTLNAHTCYDGEGDIAVDALENHCQFTVFAPVDATVRVAWSRGQSYQSHFVSFKVVAVVHDRMTYSANHNNRLGTTALTILSMFRHGSRVVFTHVMVAHDECLPLPPGDLRPYGFGWTVYEPVSKDMTLVRHSMLQRVPLTFQGTPMPLDAIGHLFGKAPRGVESREAYIAAIAAAAEANLVQSHRPPIEAFCHDIETTV